MKKIISLCITIIFCISMLTVAVYAMTPENDIQPYYVCLTGWNATLDKTSNTTARCYSRFSTEGYQTIVVTMYLMRKEGTLWKSELNWENTGTRLVTVNGTANVSTGHVYMVYAVADIYDSDGNFIERATASSNTVSY